MSFPVAVSDALNQRVSGFPPDKLRAFQLAVADIVKGRGTGDKVLARASGRVYYLYRSGGYSLYYSRDPQAAASLVFEEFLSLGEEELMLDAFAEGRDQ